MEVSIFSTIPFLLLLVSIAIFPFINRKWWEKYYSVVSVGLGLIVVIYYLIISRPAQVLLSLEEYVMFITLIASIFIVSGGILIELEGYSTPFRNILLLASGALLANIIGTIGASMVLIRPYIKTNKIRIAPFHIVFFIFIVSNIGGSLTPIGNPPLLLGFLKGVPFFWIGEQAFAKWIIAIGILLLIFYLIDLRNFKKQPDDIEKKEIETVEKLIFKGWMNVILILIVIGSVFITKPLFLRESIMIICAIASYKFTKRDIHRDNFFNFEPIKEVAWLFFGIFITMSPMLELLSSHSKALAINTPAQYYWYTGFMSSILDNAPTYLAFLTASMGASGFNSNNSAEVISYVSSHEAFLVAISISSVFFGAATYIGNAPNLIVKSISDKLGIKSPGFFGYILKYSVPILLPIYLIIWWLFIS